MKNLQTQYINIRKEKQMSFSQASFELLNPMISLKMNDILIIMFICFYIGRIYERFRHLSMDSPILSLGYEQNSINNPSQDQNQQNSQQIMPKQGNRDNNTESKIQNQFLDKQNQPVYQREQILDVIPLQEGKRNQLSNCMAAFQSHLIEKPEKIDSTMQNKKFNFSETQNEWLKERLKLDGQKIQEKSKFQILFQKNDVNLNLIRKIQKHQIITDYVLKKQLTNINCQNLKIVPLKKESGFLNENTIIEVEYYQNYANAASKPILQKRFLELNDKKQNILTSFFQHGKFRKLYRNIIKIGEGGFGTVYQAYNMLESKKCAVKKIFINKNSKQIESLLGQIKILNNLSHPNVVKYNSCWLEYAQLQEQQSYMKLIQQLGMNKKKQQSKLNLKIMEQQYQQNENNDEEAEYSYVSSKNSGISFVRSSKETTKRSIQFKKRQSTQFVDAVDAEINSLVPSLAIQAKQSLISKMTENSFNLVPVMFIQMQLCEHSLAYYIKKRQTIDRVFAFDIMSQLLNAVSYIHFNRVVHRDLKPENVLFATNNGLITVKIGDFGLAIQVSQQQYKTEEFTTNKIRAGTPSYIAPELYSPLVKVLNQQDLQRTDIYSLAVIYYQMLSKFQTSHQRSEKLLLLKEGKVAGINQFKQEKKLIQQMIKKNRPKARDIILGQNWKKLAHVILQLKKKQCRNFWIQKRQALNSNGNTMRSSFSKITNPQTKKSKLKNKNKLKNSRIKQQQESTSIYEEKLEHIENYQEDPQGVQNEQDLCTEELDLEFFNKNIKIIRRTSSVTTNSINNEVQNNIGKIQKDISESAQ